MAWDGLFWPPRNTVVPKRVYAYPHGCVSTGQHVVSSLARHMGAGQGTGVKIAISCCRGSLPYILRLRGYTQARPSSSSCFSFFFFELDPPLASRDDHGPVVLGVALLVRPGLLRDLTAWFLFSSFFFFFLLFSSFFFVLIPRACALLFIRRSPRPPQSTRAWDGKGGKGIIREEKKSGVTVGKQEDER